MKMRETWMFAVLFAMIVFSALGVGAQENIAGDTLDDDVLGDDEMGEAQILESADEVIGSELSGDAGITPDSPLWGLETAMENFNLALTFGEEAKARKRVKMAHERLLEAKVMAERMNIAALEKAREAHKNHLEKLRERLKKLENDDVRSELKTEIELEGQVKSQEEAAGALAARIELKAGNLTGEQRQNLVLIMESFRNESRKARLEIKSERERAKLKIRAKETVSKEKADEIDDRLEVEVEAESNAKGRGPETVAAQFIRIAEKSIMQAEEKIGKRGNETKIRAEFHLSNAKAELEKANAALASKNFVEAREFALQARREAHTSFTLSHGKEATMDELQKAKEELSESRLETLEKAREIRKEIKHKRDEGKDNIKDKIEERKGRTEVIRCVKAPCSDDGDEKGDKNKGTERSDKPSRGKVAGTS